MSASQNGVWDNRIIAEDVCFTVNNIGDPIPSTVRGTLFRSTKKPRSSPTALLLQHGAVSERSAWSGGAPVIAGTHDMARSLAKRGYAVFAIDRLGYGESPYERPPGSGALLTPDGYIAMTHQMVSQIRAGSHTDCAGEAAGRGAARVVLSGFSSGAAIIVGYATRHHDIDGIIPMSWSNQPQLSAAFQELLGVLVPQLAASKDYVEFFLDGADGYSEFCERFLFYAAGHEGRRARAALRARLLRRDRLPDAERRRRASRLSRPGRSRRSGTSVPPPCCSCSRTVTRPSRAPSTTAQIPTS